MSQADIIRVVVVLILSVGLFLVTRWGLKWKFLAQDHESMLKAMEGILDTYKQTFDHYTENNQRLRNANEGLLQERNDLQRSLRRFEEIQEDQERLRNLARHGSGVAPAFGGGITEFMRGIRNLQPQAPSPPPQPQARASGEPSRETDLARVLRQHWEEESRTPAAAPPQPRSWQERIVEPDSEERNT